MAYEDGMKRAQGMEQYGDILLWHYDVLVMKYRAFIEEKANLRYDENLFTEFLSEEVTILSLILPKLKGGGKKTEALYVKIKAFQPWISDILTARIRERERVFELYNIIGDSYEALGLFQL